MKSDVTNEKTDISNHAHNRWPLIEWNRLKFAKRPFMKMKHTRIQITFYDLQISTNIGWRANSFLQKVQLAADHWQNLILNSNRSIFTDDIMEIWSTFAFIYTRVSLFLRKLKNLILKLICMSRIVFYNKTGKNADYSLWICMRRNQVARKIAI